MEDKHETVEIAVERTIQDTQYEPCKVSVKRIVQLSGTENEVMQNTQRITNNLERLVDNFMHKRIERNMQFPIKDK